MTFPILRADSRVYLDHNATTPLAEGVRDRLAEWASLWGNPSSIHQSGRGPKALMRESRDKIARFLNANPLELVFTGGGSESNNLAIKGVFWNQLADATRSKRNRYLFSDVEHPSVRRTAEWLEAQGAEVEFISVDREGRIDLEAYQKRLDDRVALVSVMLANNETGTIFPIRELARLAHEHGALFHTDAVQALGKIPVDLRNLGVDLASFSGHKFYALKGCGVMFARRGLQIASLVHGGGQERHRRGGTENLLAIASLGFMCGFKDDVVTRGRDVENLRNQMETRILNEIAGVTLTAANELRIPTTSSFTIEGIDGETLLMNLDMRGFSVSTGAACSSGSPEPSPVLLAMGLSRVEAQSSLRVGIGWGTTNEEIERFVEALKSVVTHVRSLKSSSRKSDQKLDQMTDQMTDQKPEEKSEKNQEKTSHVSL